MPITERRGGWPGPRKVPLTVRLHPDLRQRLNEHTEATGRTATEVVSEALTEHLDQHDPKETP